MKRAVILKHVANEGPGRLEPLLAASGYDLHVVEMHRDPEVAFDLGADDLLIVMGGPMGVGDVDRPEFPFLRRELELLTLTA